MRCIIQRILALSALSLVLSASVGSADDTFDTLAARKSDLDMRAYELYQQVMSPFCPGRALSDCPSSKAHDLKDEMRRKLEAGIPPEEILEGVFGRFGDQYRAVPGFTGFALLAWLAPLAFLLIGLMVAIWLASSRRRMKASEPLRPVDTELIQGMNKEIEDELSRMP